jgi:hypothetical protein
VNDLFQTYLLAADGTGRQIVSVHVKLTYRVLPTGQCEAAHPEPFLNLRPPPSDDEEEDPDSDTDPEAEFPESDIIPHKLATDLIVMASAHAPPGKPVRRMTAGIDCGEFRRRFLVQGDRRCFYRETGQLAFSDAAPFEVMPLRYEHAYGGCDPTVPVVAPANVLDALAPHPGIYPRNPAGRGYAVADNRAHIDGLALPNVENPRDALTPARVVTGTPENWWRQPMPWGCDWFDATWYPRSVHLGGVPQLLPEDDSQVEEVRLGYVAGGAQARLRAAAIADMFDTRYADAASPGMVLPFLFGNEQVRLLGMKPSGPELVVQLPGKPPRMQVRHAGKTHDLEPVPNRVLISAEEMGLYIVWHGAWVPPRRLPARMRAEVNPKPGADMRGIEVLVDGKVIAPLR